MDDLARQSVSHWAICGDGERRKFREKLGKLVNLAMHEELKGYYERPGKAQRWLVTGDRLTVPAQLQRLSRLATTFVERVQKGAEFKPDQLSFDADFFAVIDPREPADDYEE